MKLLEQNVETRGRVSPQFSKCTNLPVHLKNNCWSVQKGKENLCLGWNFENLDHEREEKPLFHQKNVCIKQKIYKNWLYIDVDMRNALTALVPSLNVPLFTCCASPSCLKLASKAPSAWQAASASLKFILYLPAGERRWKTPAVLAEPQ